MEKNYNFNDFNKFLNEVCEPEGLIIPLQHIKETYLLMYADLCTLKANSADVQVLNLFDYDTTDMYHINNLIDLLQGLIN